MGLISLLIHKWSSSNSWTYQESLYTDDINIVIMTNGLQHQHKALYQYK